MCTTKHVDCGYVRECREEQFSTLACNECLMKVLNIYTVEGINKSQNEKGDHGVDFEALCCASPPLLSLLRIPCSCDNH